MMEPELMPDGSYACRVCDTEYDDKKTASVCSVDCKGACHLCGDPNSMDAPDGSKTLVKWDGDIVHQHCFHEAVSKYGEPVEVMA